MTRQIGARGVLSVNGLVGPAVNLSAAQIASDGPSTVQADLNALPSGNFTAVTSWTEFTGLATAVESPAGVWTFNESIWVAGVIVAPVGARVIGGEQSYIWSTEPSSATMIFDVDGPAISGPVAISSLTIAQNSVGPSSECLRITTSTRALFLQNLQTVGATVGIHFQNNAAPVAVANAFALQTDIGYRVSGPIDIFTMSFFGVVALNSGGVGMQIDADVVMSAGSSIKLESYVPALTSTQWGFAIAHAASIADPALIQISGGSSSGPQGRLFRQTSPGVTDMSVNDTRLVVSGNTSAADWIATAIGGRDDLNDPIVVPVSGANDVNLIPFNDPLDNLRITASTEIRFNFVFGAASPGTDWHLEYQGPLEGQTANLSTSLVAKRSSGAGPSITRVRYQINRAPAYSGWVDLASSEFTWSSSNAYTTASGSARIPQLFKNDRIRPVLINLDDAGDIDIGAIEITGGVSK